MAEILIRRGVPEPKVDDDIDVGLIYDDVPGQIIGFYGHNNTDDEIEVSFQVGGLTERSRIPAKTSTRQRLNLLPSRRMACRPATVSDHPWQRNVGFVFGGTITVERRFGTPVRRSPSILSVAVTDFLSSATTTHNVPMPATVDPNDGLGVFFFIDTASNCSATGFTPIADVTNTDRMFFFGKVAVGTEDGTNVNFLTTTTSFAVAHVYRIDAGTWAEVVDGFVATTSTGTGVNPDPPNIDIGVSNDMVILTGVMKAAGSVDSAPTNYTDYTEGAANIEGSARRTITASSENPGTFGGTTSAAWMGVTVAILSDSWDFGPIPHYVGPGVQFSGTGATSGVLPGGIVTGDLLIWTMETEGEDTNAEPLPDSWVGIDGGGGSVASATDSVTDRTRNTIGYIFYDSGSPPDLTSTDPGDHHVGVIHAFRNVDPTTPIHAVQSSSDNTNDTAMSITGVTTTLDNCLIVYVESNGDDDALGGPVGWTSVANASLDFLRSGGAGGTTQGSDGSIGLWYGGLAAQGASGTLTGTIGASEESASWCFALAPAASSSPQTIDGALFSAIATFAAGLISAGYSLSGSLFSVASSFNVGQITATRSLAGSLFTVPASFPQGLLSPGGVDLDGNLFSVLGGFGQGAISTQYALAGNPFSVLGQFGQGSISPGVVMLDGELFVVTASFSQGLMVFGLQGSLFTATSVFPTGDVIPGGVDLAGNLFTVLGQFNQGLMSLAGTNLLGNLFSVLGQFPFGTISPGVVVLDGNLFTTAASFPAGTVLTAYTLSGELFTALGSFEIGLITPQNTLAGNLFQVPANFPIGIIANELVTLFGELMVVTATFPNGVVALVALLGSLDGLRWPEDDARDPQDLARSRENITRTWRGEIRSPD